MRLPSGKPRRDRFTAVDQWLADEQQDLRSDLARAERKIEMLQGRIAELMAAHAAEEARRAAVPHSPTLRP